MNLRNAILPGLIAVAAFLPSAASAQELYLDFDLDQDLRTIQSIAPVAAESVSVILEVGVDAIVEGSLFSLQLGATCCTVEGETDPRFAVGFTNLDGWCNPLVLENCSRDLPDGSSFGEFCSAGVLHGSVKIGTVLEPGHRYLLGKFRASRLEPPCNPLPPGRLVLRSSGGDVSGLQSNPLTIGADAIAPVAFRFPDGSTQGWSLDGAYTADDLFNPTGGPDVSHFSFDWWDAIDFPDPSDPDGNGEGSIRMFSPDGNGMLGGPGRIWWVERLRSPNLADFPQWQITSGCKAQLLSQVGPALVFARLRARVYDPNTGTETFWTPGPPQVVTPLQWTEISFDWKAMPGFPADYELREVQIELWGKIAESQIGGVYLDEVDPFPVCELSASQLDFGSLFVGDSLDANFSVRNLGGGSLAGFVFESCDDFAIVGGQEFELGAGEQASFTVQFSPTVPGDQLCVLDLGAIECSTIEAIGSAELPPPTCSVDPTQLDFGTVIEGTTRDLTFSILNEGGSPLIGSFAPSCAEFTVVEGLAYTVNAGEEKTFTVRFTPVGNQVLSCVLETGPAICADVTLAAVSATPPLCVVTPSALDFGSPFINETVDRAFAIRNDGGSPLVGTVAVNCVGFTLESPADYNLAPGAEQSFTVRFHPTVPGPASCVIETGSSLCADLQADGVAIPLPACSVAPATIDFGDLLLGVSRDTTFTVTNVGGGVISGSVASSCGDFTVLSSVDYTLSAGQTKTFDLRFRTLTPGVKACSLDTGSPLCSKLSLRGTGVPPPPGCLLTPPEIRFPTTFVGATRDTTFTLANTGGGTLHGTIVSPCSVFSIVGSPSYDLASGQSQIFTLRYAPVASGNTTCLLETGDATCIDLTARGSAVIPPPACEISPSTLDFGAIQEGTTTDLTLQIRNVGGGVLSGTVTVPCSAFQVLGPASYSLTAGESTTIQVRFAPVAPGDTNCTLSSGSSYCGGVPMHGIATPEPARCLLSVDRIVFPALDAGAQHDTTFTITNAGGSVLSGTVSSTCPDFSIVGAAQYELERNEFASITVRFRPLLPGPKSCDLATGACIELPLSGVSLAPEPACDVSPTSIDFGSVEVGSSHDTTFVVTNIGGGTIEGELSLSCPDFAVVGGRTYRLDSGRSASFLVRFAPGSGGSKSCAVETGLSICADVALEGVGVEPPVRCELSASILDFGSVELGSTVDANFAIRNVGGGLLAGEVAATCGDFQILGSRSYALRSGEEAVIMVRFAPTTAGATVCALPTGSPECGSVELRAIGLELPPICELSETRLDFGEVLLGDSRVQSFEIRNAGGGTLSGSLGTSCTEFAISGNTHFALAGGQSARFDVQFSPTEEGALECVILTGVACDPLPASGTGVPRDTPPACELSTTTLDFGVVLLGSSRDDTLRVRNSGGGTLSGELASACPNFAVIGNTRYALATGEIASFIVRFAPDAEGSATCDLETGSGLCADVALLGRGRIDDPPPACSVSTVEMDFGQLVIGASLEQSFTIQNSGGGLLEGTVTADCPSFVLLGNAAYQLSGGESQSFTLRFTPVAAGLSTCSVATGAIECPGIQARGSAIEVPAICQATPSVLEFGPVQVGEARSQTLTVRNSGGGRLIGEVSVNCPDFTVVGNTAFDLLSGAEARFEVRFAPTVIGTQGCAVRAGDCDPVTARGLGTAAPAPECELTPSFVDFGLLRAGEVVEREVTLRNVGEGILSGDLTPSCPGFSVNGTATYSLENGESQSFALRFAFVEPGERSCSIPIGEGPCATLRARGVAVSNEVTLDFDPGVFRAFGLGVAPATSSAAIVFEQLGAVDHERWRLGRWSTESGKYLELGADLTTVGLNTGCWLISAERRTLTFTGEPLTSPEHEIPLGQAAGDLPGWSQVANPFQRALPVENLFVSSGLRTVRLVDPTNDLTDQSAWQWRAGTYLEVETILPHEAIWVRKVAEGPVSLVVRSGIESEAGVEPGVGMLGASSSNSVSSTSPSTSVSASTSMNSGTSTGAETWSVAVRVSQGLEVAASVVLGALPIEGDHWLPIDRGAPPTPPGRTLRAEVMKTNWGRLNGPYLRVYQPEADGMSFDLTLRGVRAAEALAIRLVESGLPAGMVATLEDLDQRTTHVVPRDGEVSLRGLREERHLRLVFSNAPETNPNAPFALAAVRPNPFSDATALFFRLPDPGTLRVRLLDARGRVVRSFVREASAGETTLHWDGCDEGGEHTPAGVYIAEYTLGDRRGSLRLIRVR